MLCAQCVLMRKSSRSHNVSRGQISKSFEWCVDGFFDLPQNISEHRIGRPEFNHLVGGSYPGTFKRKVERINGHKDRCSVLNDERVGMVQVLAEWFYLCSCFSRHQDDGNVFGS